MQSNNNIHQTLHKTVHRQINLEMMRFFGYVGGIMLLLVGTFVTSTFVQFPYEGEGFDWESTFIVSGIIHSKHYVLLVYISLYPLYNVISV